ncbi:hypothetical protein DUT91_20065 [Phyllobacterium salinisoli]|uniref:Uncharacterized protein n=1 Tax=Phyllobacterium salinisoli TaxID=1899321 RepID=A0A368K0V3_9HYPH|nr:hypothetical protein [Phyllobacterium salinisoli]RCS22032.1 hypothetical protein DUT91_20065 [Phyllobacterium salinisoli]
MDRAFIVENQDSKRLILTNPVRTIIIATVFAVVLSGCQTTEQSVYEADNTCFRSGLYPGTYKYDRCRREVFENSRRKSDNTAALLTLGVAAAAIGGAAVAADHEKKKRRKAHDRYDRWKAERHRESYGGNYRGYRRPWHEDYYHRDDGYRRYYNWY